MTNFKFYITGENFAIIKNAKFSVSNFLVNTKSNYSHPYPHLENWCYPDLFVDSVSYSKNTFKTYIPITNVNPEHMEKFLEEKIIPTLEHGMIHKITISYEKEIKISAESLDEAIEIFNTQMKEKPIKFYTLKKSFTCKSESYEYTKEDEKIKETFINLGWKVYKTNIYFKKVDDMEFSFMIDPNSHMYTKVKVMVDLKDRHYFEAGFYSSNEIIGNFNKILDYANSYKKSIFERIDYINNICYVEETMCANFKLIKFNYENDYVKFYFFMQDHEAKKFRVSGVYGNGEDEGYNTGGEMDYVFDKFMDFDEIKNFDFESEAKKIRNNPSNVRRLTEPGNYVCSDFSEINHRNSNGFIFNYRILFHKNVNKYYIEWDCPQLFSETKITFTGWKPKEEDVKTPQFIIDEMSYSEAQNFDYESFENNVINNI